MKKPIAILMVALMTLFMVTSALPLPACASTDDNKHGRGAEDTKVPKKAPFNPGFEAYWKIPRGTSYGYIPPPTDLSHLKQLPVERLPIPYGLPSSFDWRDYGKVTPVKDQSSCGTCWIFGTTSVLESAVLIGENVPYDFSEQSVALCVDRSWVYLYDDTTDPCLAGGWGWLATEAFIKKGSVLESCNPYNPSALNCDGSCVCDTCPPVKKADGYRLATNDGSQIDVIKNAVYYHEPLTVAFYYTSSGNYSVEPGGTIYDYYPCSEGANHLVSIIGWNDDVPHPDPEHKGTGAWIVKNSWGTGWGNDGFFYLAYDSSCVSDIAYLEYKDENPDEELLYWDEAGHVSSVGYGDSSAWMASVFTAAQSGDLTHVDFWTTSNNAQYEIYVWNGRFKSMLAYQIGECQEYGYYSIPLSAPISIDAGQQFTVGVKMTTPGYNYPIPIELEYPGLVDPPIQRTVSFFRHTDGGRWTDLARYGWNACLRARMVSEVPENQPPVADAGGPYTGIEDAEVTFDGSESSDPDGDPLTYTWYFGDGTQSTVTTPTTTHTYTAGQAGIEEVYTVTLIVNDGKVDSASSTTTATITGVNDAPVADAGGPYSGIVNEAIAFDGSGSSDEEGAIASYTWDFGDGTVETVTTATTTHTYTATGTYSVTLTVTDGNGETAQDITTAEVTEAPTNTMHVAGIDMWHNTAGRNYFIYTKVTIVDSENVPVTGATVYLKTTLPDSSTVYDSRSTNGEGAVTFKLRSRQTGTYTSEVTNVEKTDWEYNSDANVETSETLLIP